MILSGQITALFGSMACPHLLNSVSTKDVIRSANSDQKRILISSPGMYRPPFSIIKSQNNPCVGCRKTSKLSANKFQIILLSFCKVPSSRADAATNDEQVRMKHTMIERAKISKLNLFISYLSGIGGLPNNCRGELLQTIRHLLLSSSASM